MSEPDPRLHAYRPDVADARLKDRVVAERYVEGHRQQVIEPLVSVHKAPRPDAMQTTQALLGETVRCFDTQDGWAFVQLEADGYVGYIRTGALGDTITAPTHRVIVPSTLRYPAPSIKTQPAAFLTMTAAVTVVAEDGKFSRLHDGHYVWSGHLAGQGETLPDFAAVAAQFLHVPYYWGGKSVRGLDCSGLVQVALAACGVAALRDSDMQEQTLGHHLATDRFDALQRGDLVFWKGHVGIMLDGRTLLHANGHHMLVAAEPLDEAVKRIAGSYGHITSIKRLQ